MSCLSLEQIERFVGNSLNQTGRTQAEAHISSCAECRRQWDDVRANLSVARRVRQPVFDVDATVVLQLKAQGGADTGESVNQDSGAGSASASFPGYEVVSEISRGGQGVVYRAIQESTR